MKEVFIYLYKKVTKYSLGYCCLRYKSWVLQLCSNMSTYKHDLMQDFSFVNFVYFALFT